MTYGFEQSTGKIYSQEEYWEHYKWSLPDRGVVLSLWDILPHMEVEDEDLSHTRERLLFTYAPPESFIDKMRDIQIRYNMTVNYLHQQTLLDVALLKSK